MVVLQLSPNDVTIKACINSNLAAAAGALTGAVLVWLFYVLASSVKLYLLYLVIELSDAQEVGAVLVTGLKMRIDINRFIINTFIHRRSPVYLLSTMEPYIPEVVRRFGNVWPEK